MSKFIGVFIAIASIPQPAFSQNILDSLQVDQLRQMETISTIYPIPHSIYTLDHFVLVRKTKHIDPQVQYNKGERISEESSVFLNRFNPGDTLMVKEIYAINGQSPEKGLVKFPEKRFLLK